MTDGVIEGGWGYVMAAYGISWAALAAYAFSLYLRAKREPTP
jgi:hypothetical protein